MGVQLRRFALAFIHLHSGATGVFRNAFMGKVAEATSCLPKTLQTTWGVLLLLVLLVF